MAFKLLVELNEDGSLNISHEGQIDPTLLLGTLRRLEHDILMTIDVIAAQEALDGIATQTEGE